MIDPTRYGTVLGLTLLGETLGGCRSVTWPTVASAVLCQKPADHVGRHSADIGYAVVDWADPTGYTHSPEVVSGECDPDLEHDVWQESQEENL